MMFELPEVETVRRELDRDLVGKKVKTVEASSMAVLKRYKNRKAFPGQLDDMKITGVGRRGLYLLIVLDGDSTLVVNLGSSGSLRRNANKDKVEDSTEVVITFTQHGQLRLVDPDGTAEMFVVDTAALADEIPELEDHGLDPVDEPVSWTEFGRALLQRSVLDVGALRDEGVPAEHGCLAGGAGLARDARHAGLLAPDHHGFQVGQLVSHVRERGQLVVV